MHDFFRRKPGNEELTKIKLWTVLTFEIEDQAWIMYLQDYESILLI